MDTLTYQIGILEENLNSEKTHSNGMRIDLLLMLSRKF